MYFKNVCCVRFVTCQIICSDQLMIWYAWLSEACYEPVQSLQHSA